jgi:hypothetical protein
MTNDKMTPHWSISTLQQPSVECLTVDALKAHLRVTVSDDDDLIGGLIPVARELVENWTRRAILPTQYQICFDRFPLLANTQYSPGNPNVLAPVVQNFPLDPSPWSLLFPRSPLISVDAVQYVDLSLNLQTMAASGYIVDAQSEPGRITTATGGYWPATAFVPRAVRISFTAGYATSALVPPTLKQAIKMLVGAFYDSRDWHTSVTLADAPPAVAALVAMNEVKGFW